jgi:hypothetical protein
MIPSEKKEKKNLLEQLALFIPVWVQIVVCIGGIFVASLPSILPKIFPEVTSTPTFTSMNMPLLESTLMVYTPTPLPKVSETQLPCTFTRTCLPGDDWKRNCISGEIWDTSLAGESLPEPGLCYDLAAWGMTADDGALTLAATHSDITAHEYGIFTPWQDWTKFDFSVRVKRLDNSELWFGFFEGNTLNSKGILFVIQHGDVVDVRDMPSGKEIVANFYLPFADGVFHPQVILRGGKFSLWIDGQGILSNWPLNYTIHNMFIGYRSLPVINLDATIFNLKFTP